MLQSHIIKGQDPNSKTLAKRTRKSTPLDANVRLAFNLRFVWPLTCVNVRVVFSPLATQSRSQVSYICVEFTTFCDLRDFASRLASPFGRPSQVRTQVLVLQICVDLNRLASPFGQGLIAIVVPWIVFFSSESGSWSCVGRLAELPACSYTGLRGQQFSSCSGTGGTQRGGAENCSAGMLL